MRFTDPSRLDGTSILMVEESTWYFNKRTNRVRLLSKAAKNADMMGSSFSYDDMNQDYIKDFDANIISEDNQYYTLKLIPKEKNKNYKYIISKVQKSNYIAISADYYNKDDLKYKFMICENIKNINNHIVPLKITMTDILSRKKTIFEIEESSIKYDINLGDNIFSYRNLKR
jgi:hypothetical protein